MQDNQEVQGVSRESERCFDPLGDGKSRLQLIDWMGGDLSVVNDAKASFERQSSEMGEKEIRLINYLAQHNHSSPFRGTVFKFRVKAPLYVCRQWVKHIVASNHNDEQLGWNEKSFRYTEINDAEDFYVPQGFRLQSKSNRQVSDEALDNPINQQAIATYRNEGINSYSAYRRLLELGVGREQARGVLVPAVYTTWVWTVSLQALLHFMDLRLGKGAQSEIVKYAEALEQLVTPVVPEAIKAWRGARGKEAEAQTALEDLAKLAQAQIASERAHLEDGASEWRLGAIAAYEHILEALEKQC